MKKTSRFTARRAARFFAVQALYQQEHSDQPLSLLMAQFIREHLSNHHHETAVKADESLFVHLVNNAFANKEALDEAVGDILSEGWTTARLDEVVLSVLRLGAYECLFDLETPIAVIVNEYIEVSKAFFSATEVNFIHVALDLLGKKRGGNDSELPPEIV